MRQILHRQGWPVWRPPGHWLLAEVVGTREGPKVPWTCSATRRQWRSHCKSHCTYGIRPSISGDQWEIARKLMGRISWDI
jgi:hypothetical protein